jgi:hypothetical protein
VELEKKLRRVGESYDNSLMLGEDRQKQNAEYLAALDTCQAVARKVPAKNLPKGFSTLLARTRAPFVKKAAEGERHRPPGETGGAGEAHDENGQGESEGSVKRRSTED